MTEQLVGLAPWTVIAQICNLLIQLYIVKRFLFKPVLAIIEKRKALADAQIADATKAKEEAQEMKVNYEKSIANAKQEAHEILKSAQQNAAARSEAIISEAQAQAASIKSKAETDIVQERRKAVNEIKNEIGGIAMEIAGKVIEREVKEEDHKKLIDEFIQNVGEAS